MPLYLWLLPSKSQVFGSKPKFLEINGQCNHIPENWVLKSQEEMMMGSQEEGACRQFY